MGGKSKAPKAPDYVALAKQQAADQQALLQQQTVANRADQIGPMGSLKWKQDPTTGKWTQTEEWDPRLQDQMNQALDLQSSQMGQIKDLMAQGGFDGGSPIEAFKASTINRGAMPTYDPTTGDKYGNTVAQTLLSRLRPKQQIDQEQMATKLRLQGLQPGTAAYDRAYKNLLTSQGDVNAQAELQGWLAGAGESHNIFNSQLAGQQQDFAQQLGLSEDNRANYGTGLAGQAQDYNQLLQNYLLPWQTAQMTQGLANNIQQPNFRQYNTAEQGKAADILGASQQQYAQQMQQYNEQAQKKQGKGSSIGSLVGAVGGSFFGMPQLGAMAGGALGGSLASDLMLKEDVAQLSDEECYEQMKKMLPISWRWTGTSVQDMGISAQQVLELAPELVDRGNRGLLRVNYTALFARLLGAFRHMAKTQSVEEAANAA